MGPKYLIITSTFTLQRFYCRYKVERRIVHYVLALFAPDLANNVHFTFVKLKRDLILCHLKTPVILQLKQPI